MTRLKKLLISAVMVIVTLCISLSSALLNITQTIFSGTKVKADSYDYSNSHNEDNYKEGSILTVNGQVPGEMKRGEEVSIPLAVLVKDNLSDTNTLVYGSASKLDGANETIETYNNVQVLIKNPYGIVLANTADETLTNGLTDDGKLQLGAVSEKATVNAVLVNETSVTSVSDADVLRSYTFKPTQTGVYTVQYAYKGANSIWTLSDIYEIYVTAESYAIELDENDAVVMPSKIDTNQDVDTTISIALPRVYDENGEQITKLVLGKNSQTDAESGVTDTYYYLAEYKNVGGEYGVYLDGNKPVALTSATDPNAEGKNVYDEYYTYAITGMVAESSIPSEYKYGLAIDVSLPITNTKLSNISTDADALLKLNNYEDNATYLDTAYTFKAESGKNIITYSLCSANFSDVANPTAFFTKTLEGSTAYAKGDIELGASVSSNVRSSATSVNVKTYLPKVSAVDKNANKNALDAHYYYEVAYIDESGTKDVSKYGAEYVTMGVDEAGIYFIPHKIGTYNVYYNAVDFYGHTDKSAEDYDYDLSVSDRTSPSLYFVKSYDPAESATTNKVDISEDYSYTMPSTYYITEDAETVIAVPAIFTEDNYKAFADLRIRRTITSESGFIDKDGKSVKNFSLNIQDTDGKTDFDAEDSTKNIDKISNVIYFDTFTGTDFKVVRGADNKTTFSSSTPTTAGGDEYAELTGEALRLAKTSQVAYIKLDPALFGEGEYTIEYSVQDGVYSNNTGKTFTFNLVKVSSSDVLADKIKEMDDEDPTIEFAAATIGNVINNQEISIAKPTVKDSVDARPLVRYYIVANDVYSRLYLDDDDKLTFNTGDVIDETNNKSIYDLASESAEKSFKVVAIAYDDFATISDDPADDYANANDGKHIGADAYTISVKYVDDSLVPVISSVTDSSVYAYTEDSEYKQFGEVSVHGIVFYDNTASAQVSASVVDSDGVEVAFTKIPGSKVKKLENAPSGLDASYVYEYTFAGVKFTASKATNYTVRYSVVDSGNNVTVYTFVIRQAQDAEGPVITGLTNTTATVELGSSYYLSSLKATDNSGDAVTFEVEVVDAKGNDQSDWFNTENMTFTPKAVGTYTLTLVAKDSSNNPSVAKTVVVTVKDTLLPTLTLIGATGDLSFNENTDWDDNGFDEIELPGFSVADQYPDGNIVTGFRSVIGATGTLTITTPNNDTYTIDNSGNVDNDGGEIELKLDGGKFYFTPTERGHYTATYIATDFNGNQSKEQTINVYIGDTENPVIYLSDSMRSTLNKGFVVGSSDQLVINTYARIKDESGYNSQSLYVSDNYGFKTQTDSASNFNYVIVNVSLYDENNKQLDLNTDSDNLAYYTFTTKGTYTLTFTVSDKVGNTGTLSKTFTVTSTTSTSTDSSQVLGIVLIIISIAVLAGVVIYFVRGTKFLPKKRKAKKAKVENKEETVSEENKD